MSSRCTSHRRRRFAALLAVVLGGVGVAGQVAALAADKSSKSDARRERQAKEKSGSNKAVRTQQRTADAFAEKDKSKKSEGDQPVESVESLQAQLADVEDRIRKEDDRHESTLADLGDAASGKQAAKARKAIEKEESTHRRNRAALDEDREALRVKLDALKPKSPAKPTPDDRTAATARTK